MWLAKNLATIFLVSSLRVAEKTINSWDLVLSLYVKTKTKATPSTIRKAAQIVLEVSVAL